MKATDQISIACVAVEPFDFVNLESFL